MNEREPTRTRVAGSALTEGPLLCPHEAATLLSVKPSWVYEAVRAQRIPCLRVGRHIRFTRAMLEQWLAEHVDG
jgi:excisionase family DNA binding protein